LTGESSNPMRTRLNRPLGTLLALVLLATPTPAPALLAQLCKLVTREIKEAPNPIGSFLAEFTQHSIQGRPQYDATEVKGMPPLEGRIFLDIAELMRTPDLLGRELTALDSLVKKRVAAKTITPEQAVVEIIAEEAPKHRLGTVELTSTPESQPLDAISFLALFRGPNGTGNILLNDPDFSGPRGKQAPGRVKGSSNHGARTHAVQQYVSMKYVDRLHGPGSYSKFMNYLSQPGTIAQRGIEIRGISEKDKTYYSLWGYTYDYANNIYSAFTPEGFYYQLHRLNQAKLLSFEIP